MNNFALIGQLTKLENNKMTLHSVSAKKDIEVILSENLFKEMKKSAKVGTLIGVKGFMDVNEKNHLYLRSEKVTILQTTK